MEVDINNDSCLLTSSHKFQDAPTSIDRTAQQVDMQTLPNKCYEAFNGVRSLHNSLERIGTNTSVGTKTRYVM